MTILLPLQALNFLVLYFFVPNIVNRKNLSKYDTHGDVQFLTTFILDCHTAQVSGAAE